MSFSHEYNLPVFIGTGAVLTSGDTSKLVAGQIGIFDAKTYTVPTGPAERRQSFLIASGSWHTKDKLNKFVGGLKESDKTIPFLGSDIYEFHRSLPRAAQSEQWTIGWDGIGNDTLVFREGQTNHYRVKVWGEDVYGTFLRPIDRFIDVKADCPTVDECATGNCSDIVAPKQYAQRLADNIMADPELQYFLQAEVIASDMVPVTPTHHLFSLTVCDNGDAGALAAVQTQYPTLQIFRVSRSGSLSTYEFCNDDNVADPADFQPTAAVSLAICGACDAGYTLVAAKDVFVVKRALLPSTDINSDADKATYAATIVTAYSGISGSGKFLNQIGSTAIVEFSKAVGATPTPVNSDIITKVRTEGASCVPTAADPIEWVEGDERYKTTRTLEISLEKVCGTGNRLAELQAAYANETSIVANSIVVYATGDCGDTYRLRQYNNDCLVDGCLTNASPAFDGIQSFEGFTWSQVPVVSSDVDVKVGVRITAAYEDTRFGGCSFSPVDYYSVRPLKFEVTEFNDRGLPCEDPVPSRKVRNSSMPTQSGEYVIREFIKANRYKVHANFYHDVRLREVLDANVHEVVDRNKTYKLYFLKVQQDRSGQNHVADFSPEIFEFMFAFPIDVDTSAFEIAIEKVTSQFGVYLKDR